MSIHNLFAEPTELFSNSTYQPIQVIDVTFNSFSDQPAEELFSGYDYLHVITFSYGLDFIEKIAGNFKRMDIILGNEATVKSDIKELICAQELAAEQITLLNISRRKTLMAMAQNGTLDISLTQFVHRKLYLLSANDGRTRVITGSANFSKRGFDGSQDEIYVKMDNQPDAFEYFKRIWHTIRTDARDKGINEALFAVVAESTNPPEPDLNLVPSITEVNVKKAITIIAQDSSDNEQKQFTLDVSKLSKKYLEGIPKIPKSNLKDNGILITPKLITAWRTKLKDVIAEKAAEEVKLFIPKFEINYSQQTCSLNGNPYNMEPTLEAVKHDLQVLDKLLQGFNDYPGDPEQAKKSYYMLLIFMLVSPFIPRIRYIAKTKDFDVMAYPYFAFLFGKRYAGKSAMVGHFQTMIFGKKFGALSAKIFTQTGMGETTGSKVNAKGERKEYCRCIPLEIEDLDQERFDMHGRNVIKNDTDIFEIKVQDHPTFIITTNYIEALDESIAKRSVYLRVPIENEGVNVIGRAKRYSDLAAESRQALSMAFFGDMIPIVEAVISKMLEYRTDTAAKDWYPDIFELGSELFLSFYDKCGLPRPEYASPLNYGSYARNEANYAPIKEFFKQKWLYSKDCFEVSAKNKQLIFDTKADSKAAQKIKYELPIELNADILDSKVIMNLTEAEKFFGIIFTEKTFVKNLINYLSRRF